MKDEDNQQPSVKNEGSTTSENVGLERVRNGEHP
jgi:hypothetical protein